MARTHDIPQAPRPRQHHDGLHPSQHGPRETSRSPRSRSGTPTPTPSPKPTIAAPAARTSSRPTTPSRGRAPSSRYPADLRRDPDRVPLHRRGTSKTYERLEDLLKEAGYKDTRVFTPEAERAEAEAEARKVRTSSAVIAGAAGGVGAVVGFLSGLVPSSGKVMQAGAAQEVFASPESNWSPPPSPLANKQARRRSNVPIEDPMVKRPTISASPSSQTLASTLASNDSLATLSSSGLKIQLNPSHTPSRRSTMHEYQDPDQQSARPQPSKSRQTYSEASQARQYLRHMASAPNMVRRRPGQGSDNSLQRASSSRHVVTLNDEGAPPPLPQTWLETVAKAVLGGGVGAHIGGPSTAGIGRAGSPRKRPGYLQSALSDYTNVTRSTRSPSIGHLAPPHASYTRRSPSTPGEVCTAQVVCRSAPSSRSSSQVRSGIGSGALEVMLGRGRSRRARGKGRERDARVPVLANTRVENDDVWGGDDADWASDSSEDDDDGELNLARLLVPPKRQQSIRSLRRHLERSPAPRGAIYTRTRGSAPRAQVHAQEDGHSDDPGARWDVRARGRRGSGEGEETDESDWSRMLAPGTKRRRGLPGPWATTWAKGTGASS